MNWNVKKIGLTFIVSLGMLGHLVDAKAAPSIWWDHLENRSGETVSNCVSRASETLQPDKSHHITIDADSVRSWSERTVGIVECIQFGDNVLTAILVTGEDAGEGAALFKKIREGMRFLPQAPPIP